MNGEAFVNKVIFQTFARVSDGAGGFLPGNRQNVLETFAGVKPIKASRTAENFQVGINSVYELKLLKRACFDPQSNYNVLWKNKDYSIAEIIENPKDNKEWLITITDRGTRVQDTWSGQTPG